MRRVLLVSATLSLILASVVSNTTTATASGTVYISGPVTVDNANPIQGSIVTATVYLVNDTGSTFSAKLWGIGGRGPAGWEQDIQDCGFLSDYTLESGFQQGMQCQIVARSIGRYQLFAVYQDYGGGWHEVFGQNGASLKGYFTVQAPAPVSTPLPPPPPQPTPKPDRNSLPVTSSPQVGHYFRMPRNIPVFKGPDGDYQNTIAGGLAVMIKDGPRTGKDGRTWWDLSEKEFGGGTGWFSLEDPRPAPTPVPTPKPTLRPTPPPPPAQPQGYCYQIGGLSYPGQLGTNQVGTVSLTLTNCGQTWDHDILLGTWNPQDAASPFFTGGWSHNNRAALLPGNINPGQSIAISFPIQAPATPGTYSQSLRLVAEWRAWMPGPDITITVQVGSSTPASGMSDDDLFRSYVRYYYETGRLDFPPLHPPTSSGKALNFLKGYVRQTYIQSQIDLGTLNDPEVQKYFYDLAMVLIQAGKGGEIALGVELTALAPNLVTAYFLIEALSGSDLLTGEQMGDFNRAFNVILAAVPAGFVAKGALRGATARYLVSPGEMDQLVNQYQVWDWLPSLNPKLVHVVGAWDSRFTDTNAAIGSSAETWVFYDGDGQMRAVIHQVVSPTKDIQHIHIKSFMDPNGVIWEVLN